MSNSKNKLVEISLILFICIIFSGCTAKSVFVSPERLKYKPDIIDENKRSKLLLMREGWIGHQTAYIYINDKHTIDLSPGEMFEFDLSPGTYKIGVKSKNVFAVIDNLKVGKVGYPIHERMIELKVGEKKEFNINNYKGSILFIGSRDEFNQIFVSNNNGENINTALSTLNNINQMDGLIKSNFKMQHGFSLK